jgi:hypothetical protein
MDVLFIRKRFLDGPLNNFKHINKCNSCTNNSINSSLNNTNNNYYNNNNNNHNMETNIIIPLIKIFIIKNHNL